jgi:predicted nucleic acid-binding Zn ribbon protein
MRQSPRPERPVARHAAFTSRERVLAAWRGVDVTSLESAGKNHSQPLSALVPQVLTGLGLDKRRAEAEIIKVWNSLLDPSVTAHAQPAGINKGTLFVTVDSSAWLDEIVRYRRREILDRLQHSFGKETVKKISFRVG